MPDLGSLVEAGCANASTGAVRVEEPSPKRPRVKDADILGEGPQVNVHVGEVVRVVPQGTRVCEVLKGHADSDVIAAYVDNELVPLSLPVEGTKVNVEPVPLASSDGVRVLIETLKFLLTIALHDCFPELNVTIGKPIGASNLCLFSERKSGNAYLPTEAELGRIEQCMKDLVAAALPLQYVCVERMMAIEHYKARGQHLSAQVLEERMSSQVQCVQCKGMYHMPRIAMASSTAMVPVSSFSLVPFKDGFLMEHFRYNSGSGKLERASPDTEKELLYTEYKQRLSWAQSVELQSVAQLNNAFRGGRVKQVIQAVEANCDRQFVEMAAQVKARPDTKLILIAGPSASGKTTFAKRLQVQLESLGFKPMVLSVDNYYRAWQELTSEGPEKVDWEELGSLNMPMLNQNLTTLLSGKEDLIPEYNFKTSMPEDRSHWKAMRLAPGNRSLIIMEGIHCLNPKLTESVPRAQKFQIAIAPIPALQLDEAHVLSGTSIRMLRRMVRDHLNRGRPVLSTLRQWPAVAAGEVKNIYPHQCEADTVMNTEIGYEMSVLKVHVEPLLKQVPHTEPEYGLVRRLLKLLDQFIAIPSGNIPPQSLMREFVGGSWYYDFGGWYKDY